MLSFLTVDSTFLRVESVPDASARLFGKERWS